jgi:hypothetical protein
MMTRQRELGGEMIQNNTLEISLEAVLTAIAIPIKNLFCMKPY